MALHLVLKTLILFYEQVWTELLQDYMSALYHMWTIRFTSIQVFVMMKNYTHYKTQDVGAISRRTSTPGACEDYDDHYHMCRSRALHHDAGG